MSEAIERNTQDDDQAASPMTPQQEASHEDGVPMGMLARLALRLERALGGNGKVPVIPRADDRT